MHQFNLSENLDSLLIQFNTLSSISSHTCSKSIPGDKEGLRLGLDVKSSFAQ